MPPSASALEFIEAAEILDEDTPETVDALRKALRTIIEADDNQALTQDIIELGRVALGKDAPSRS